MARSTPRNPRSMLIAVVSLGAAIVVALGVFVVAIPSLTESGKVEVRLGDEVFRNIRADEELADEIAENGPVLFSDVAGGTRDIFLQHVGDDADEGWLVFDARPPDVGRDCTLEWDRNARVFAFPAGSDCPDETFPPDGEGLKQYPVEVDEDDVLVVDLNFEDRPPETTSTVRITGGPDRD